MTADLKVNLGISGSPIANTDEPAKEETQKAEEKKTPVFMQAHDVTTANEEDAKQIGEFLNSRAKQKERKNELQEYFMETGKTKRDARKLAKAQVKNEKSQANAKRTVVFIDKTEYENFLKDQKEDSPYKATLIEDPEVLQMIRGERLQGPTVGQRREIMQQYFELDENGQPKKNEDGSPILKDGVEESGLDKFFTKDAEGNYNFDSEKFKANQKEEHLKKFYQTDEEGNLKKDDSGNYIFDSDKYKTEMEKDVTAYKLTIADREQAAQERGYDKSDEKHAIEATGMDVKKDRTWLYRGLYLAGVAAAAIFTKAKANAYADANISVRDCDGNPIPFTDSEGNEHTDGTLNVHDEAHAEMRAWPVLGLAAATPLIKDKDCDDGRAAAQREIEPERKQPCPECPECPTVEEDKAEEENSEDNTDLINQESSDPIIPTQIDINQQSCGYKLDEDSDEKVDVIKFGGYYHYALLYNNCEGNKPLTSAQIKELTQLLKPGHESSIQKDGKQRVLQKEITLKDGTKVCLVDEEERKKRIAKMNTKSGGKDMALGNRKYSVSDCHGNNKQTFNTKDEAQAYIDEKNGVTREVKAA